MKTRSLKGSLAIWLAAVLSVLLIVDAWFSYRDALSAANHAYDRSLSASLKGIAERIQATENEITVDIPYSALELFEAGSSDRVFYSVAPVGEASITGYEGMPYPEKMKPNVAVFYDATYRGETLRLGAMLKPLYRTEFPKPVVVIFGETTNSRQEVVLSLFFGEIGRKTVLIAVALGVALLATRLSIKPVEKLGSAIRSRPDDDLTPIDAGGVPLEVIPLVDAINLHLDRITRMLEARRRFITDAAHQLRTPLAVLNAQADYAQRQNTIEDMRPAVDAFHHSLGSAIRLTNQMLSLARAEPVNGLIGRQQVDLAAIARDTVIELLPLAARKSIDLGVEGENAVPVVGDPVLLREMLANLIDNGLRYTPDGGRVTVAVERTPADAPPDVPGQAQEQTQLPAFAARLTVTDNGPGIPEQHRENVFLRFFRLDATDHLGSGLGLSIVREIVHGHGGQIALLDPPTGHGLVVQVTLPVA